MTDMSLMPINGGMGNGTAAGVGGALGAIVGNWLNPYGAGRGVGAGVVAGEAVASRVDPMLMDAITANGGAIAAGNTANLQSFSQLQNTVNQAAAGINTAVLTGDMGIQNTVAQAAAGLNDSVNNSGYQTQNALAQGFYSVNNSIVSQGYQNQLATAGLEARIASCCCETQKAIAAEGAATRKQIQDNLITQLQTELCDKKSEISFLRSEVAMQASQAAQTALLEQKIAQSMATVIAHIPKP